MSTKLEGINDAVADGLRTTGLLARIKSLEVEKRRLETEIEAPAPSPVRLHPNRAKLYRQKVADLGTALDDPAMREDAIEILRGLIDRVVLAHNNVS